MNKKLESLSKEQLFEQFLGYFYANNKFDELLAHLANEGEQGKVLGDVLWKRYVEDFHSDEKELTEEEAEEAFERWREGQL